MKQHAVQKSEFRTEEGARISIKQMTQAEAEEATKAMAGWRVADDEDLAVLKETNAEVRKILDESWAITAKKGMERDGPCELLENGKRTPLYDKPWNTLSDKEKDKILDKFFKLPEEKRAWEYSGSGPVA